MTTSSSAEAVGRQRRRSGRARREEVRTFVWRGGVGITGTHVTCDAAASASDLVFLSHAQAVGAPGQRRFPLRGAGRHQILATETTLTLLGRTGETLRRHALPASFGRPFTLGALRLELFPSGHLPGGAALLCELDGRRLIYAGSVRRGPPMLGATAAEVRNGDALCLDATFADARFRFPARAEALAAVRAFVADAQAAGRPPVLLVHPFGGALDAAEVLAQAGVALRGHRAVVGAAVAFRAAGIAAPVITRFSGRLQPGEALLWPPEASGAPQLRRLDRAVTALVSGWAVDPVAIARVQADVGIPLADRAGHDDLLALVTESGAQEIALCRGFAESFAEELRGRGLDAYALGPPRQMELFQPGDAVATRG